MRNLEHLRPGQFAKIMDTLGADRHGQEIAAAWIAKEKLRDVLNLRARLTVPDAGTGSLSPRRGGRFRAPVTGAGTRRWPAYLSSLVDAVGLVEAKLLLVGEGNVGKAASSRAAFCWQGASADPVRTRTGMWCG